MPAHVSNLKRIAIKHSDVSGGAIACAIRLPKALEEFTFFHGGLGSFDSSSSLVYAEILGKVLSSQKSSFTRLDLDIDDLIFWGGPDRDEMEDSDSQMGPSSWKWDMYIALDVATSNTSLVSSDVSEWLYGNAIGSLKDSQQLKHLSIGGKLLLGKSDEAPFRLVDTLSANLETLTIRGYKPGVNPEWTAQISELMQKHVALLPNLKEILGVETEVPAVATQYKLDRGYGHCLNADDKDEQILWQEVRSEGRLGRGRKMTLMTTRDFWTRLAKV